MKSIKTFNVFILVTFSFLSMLSPIAIDMYLPAMPEIVSHLHTSTMSLQFSLQAFLAGLAFGRLVYGPVSDALGRYPVLLVSLIFYMAISIGIAVCDNMLTFNILRLLQGLAASGISVIVIAMIHDRFTGDSFSRCISLVSMVMTAAPLFSPTIGAYLSVYLGWEAIFWLFAICALLGIIISLRNLNESLDLSVRHRLSLVVICRNYVGIIKHCPSYLYILSGALSFSGVFCFLTTGSFIYQHIYHVDVVSVGYLLGLNIIVLLIFTTLNSLFVKRVGSLNLLLLFTGIQLFASLWLIFVSLYFPSLALFVIGVSFYTGVNSAIYANALSGLLRMQMNKVGTAAAIFGAACFGLAAIIGVFLTQYHILQTLPTSIFMFICALVSFIMASSAFILSKK